MLCWLNKSLEAFVLVKKINKSQHEEIKAAIIIVYFMN
jgi:hypothetical protein